MGLAVEICVVGVESALAAQEGGADRVELCEDLSVGGVTPSAGAIAVACARLTIPVHVLIRPRGGDFCYSDVEVEVMARDIEVAKSLGASGVVLGVLDRAGAVDRPTMGRLLEVARPLAVTFHKAFDECSGPVAALETLVDLGVGRVLTSGGSRKAIDGLGRLLGLVAQSDGRIGIMAGGGITARDASTLVASGLEEVHIGSSVCVGGRTDAASVRRAVETIKSGAGGR